jgi:hypothetical protein
MRQVGAAWTRRLWIVFGSLTVATLSMVATPSDANAAWSTPQAIFSVAGVSNLQLPRVARDAAGDAVAVWERYPEKGDWGAVEAITRRAGGPWSSAIRLGFGSTGAGSPGVVMDSGGEATVVWEQSTLTGKQGKKQSSARMVVDARSHHVNGGWGHAAVLASGRAELSAIEEHPPDPQVAAGVGGDVSVAFNMRERNATPFNGREDILLFTRRDGRWRSPAMVAHTVNSSEMRLALDRRGETILAWAHGGPSGEGESWVEALTFGSNGKPEAPAQALSAKSRAVYALDLAVNPRGAAVLTWSRELPEGEGYGPVEVATRPAGRRFTTRPVRLVHKSLPAVAAIDAQGTATVLFERSIAKGPTQEAERGPLEAATHPADGGWSKPGMVFPQANPQALACGPHGERVALWEAQLGLSGQPPERRAVIAASIAPAGGAWRPPETISPAKTSEEAGLALADNGHATAIWLREPTYGAHLVETADYEPA